MSNELPQHGDENLPEKLLSPIPLERATHIPRIGRTEATNIEVKDVALEGDDAIRAQGWNPDRFNHLEVGHCLPHGSHDFYEIVEKTETHLRVKNRTINGRTDMREPLREDAEERIIQLGRATLRTREYAFDLGENQVVIARNFVDLSDEESDAIIGEMIRSTPINHLGAIHEIHLTPQCGRSYGLHNVPTRGDRRRITVQAFYGFQGEKPSVTPGAFHHEFGHGIVHTLTGEVDPGEKWQAAMEASLAKVASGYSRLNRIEDFPETVRLYLSADGAMTPENAELRRFLEPRFDILDRIFNKRLHDEVTRYGSSVRRVLERSGRSKNPLA